MASGLSLNGCWHSKNQFEERKQDWLVQKFMLRWLQRLDAIQAETLVSPLSQETKRRLCLQGGVGHHWYSSPFNVVSTASSSPKSIGSFSNDDGDGNQDVNKAIGLLRKTTTLHVHHAFCTFLYRPCTTTTWKCLIASLMEDVNKRRRISFSLSKLECGPQEINSREIRRHLPFSANWNKRDKDWKNGNSF